MKVTIVEVPAPMFTSFTMFEDIDRNRLAKEKKIKVSYDKKTKTRIFTSMQLGEARLSINIPVEGFKFHEESGYSFTNSKYVTRHYFRKLKSQGFEEYKEYLKKMIPIVIKEHFKLDLDEVTVELEKTPW